MGQSDSRAFRWVLEEGMTAIASVPLIPRAASADGDTVVATSITELPVMLLNPVGEPPKRWLTPHSFWR